MERFIIQYCNILDSVFVIDSLGRMPLTRVHDQLSVHGLDCNDRGLAEEVQKYYETLFGYQKPLIQTVTGFNIQTDNWLDNYGTVYAIFDNNNHHILSSFDKTRIYEFKEWLERELNK